MKRKNKFLYSSSIKLGPALGDWTQLSSGDLEDEYFDVTTISSTNFDKLSRQELKKSHLIHHKLASLISKHLSKDMNIKIELHTIMVTQILYSDFINSINDNIFQADLNIGEQGSVNIIFGSNLASMMIDRLTGGKGENTQKSSFNELEMTLLNEQLQEIIPFFTTSWNESLDISNAKLSLYSGEYKVDNKISYRETYIVFTVYLYFGDGELMRLMIAYPNELIRNLLKQEMKSKQVISPEIKFQQDTLDKVTYGLKAELGEIELPMQSLAELSEGDVIPLNQEINTLINIDIGNKIKLYGQPCIFKNKLGCQIIVTEDNKSNIILSKKDSSTEKNVKKVRLPIEEIVDQEKKSKPTIFNLDSEIEQNVKSDNLVDYLPKDLNTEGIQDNEEEDISIDASTEINELTGEEDQEIENNSELESNELESPDQDETNISEESLDVVSNSESDLNEESQDISLIDDSSEQDTSIDGLTQDTEAQLSDEPTLEDSSELESEPTNEEASDDDSLQNESDIDEEVSLEEATEGANEDDTQEELIEQSSDQAQEITTVDDTSEAITEESDLSDEVSSEESLDSDLDFDDTDDLSLEGDDLIDEENNNIQQDPVANEESPTADTTDEVSEDTSDSNVTDADDLIDEELDFGDIEASLEDDSLDWDETEPEEPK